ncbi:Abi family protein [Corynebacterium oculi]|uniref:Abi-like protein n=1 Tax=Corynebacterium oculi TaxID=1544416 RepID=A0A0Q0U032_9CORY|nr:Abi family protein [Corynebacterium oculi]KQB84958.1 Abi-like protein [Corynebacterium oculi]
MDKAWASLEDQVAILIRRGLTDAGSFRDDLAAIGYYRLGGYMYPLRQLAPTGTARRRLSNFVPGATMQNVVDLYCFDERLRQATWQAVSTLEICFRADIGYVLGELDPYIHLTPTQQWPSGAMAKRAAVFESRLAQTQARSSEDFVKHYNKEHQGRLPVWVVAEILEFGQLVTLFSLTPYSQRQTIADLYSARADELESWMRTINYVRNLCAHHARLWNRRLVIRPLTKHRKNDADLGTALSNNSKMYSALSLIAFLLRRGRFNEPVADLKRALGRFPEGIPGVHIGQMGAKPGWKLQPIWASYPTRAHRHVGDKTFRQGYIDS